MRLVSIKTLQPGMKLGKPIYNENGQILLNEKIELQEPIISRLSTLGIRYVYVLDGMTDDIKINDPISLEIVNKAQTTIINTFKGIPKGNSPLSSIVVEKASKQFVDLIRTLLEELESKEELLNLMVNAFTHDEYIFTHSLNVTLYSIALGIELKLPKKELEILGMGAIFHDIGKLHVPKEVLLKPGKLTDEEYDIIKKHALDGFNILRKVNTIPLAVAHCAFQHHERLNGSGYPRGIKEKDISIYSKIIAVADVFDAITSNRVYRRALLPHEGLEILYAGASTLFDKQLVEIFRFVIAIYPVGMQVTLSNGYEGVVIGQNVGLSDRPIVRILKNNGNEVEPFDLDLKSSLSVTIIDCSVNN